jgi:hypothetical protein
MPSIATFHPAVLSQQVRTNVSGISANAFSSSPVII